MLEWWRDTGSFGGGGDRLGMRLGCDMGWYVRRDTATLEKAVEDEVE